ncbi:MAG: hypothetical protein CMF41_02230 [Legionellales bacterium]|nr:hypothetical protein [Legionellales bacterium]|tara:strand:+ start:1280 stop:1573 length:294 start_codon:yes stop_codon:yes gene_type:complete
MENVPLVKENKPNTQLNRIEQRLSNVEGTLQELLEKGDLMQENLEDKIGQVMEEVEKQTLAVRRMQRKMSQKITSKTLVIIIILVVSLFIFVLNFYY